MRIFFFVSSTITILLLSIDYVKPNHVGSDHHWDFLIYTQSWPVTVCREWKEKNIAHKCALPKDMFWSIHGIWPTQIGKVGPAFCNNSWHFDQEQIKPIERPLIEKWINVELDTSTYAFWGHEWSKHGTCAAVLDSLNSEYKYFNQGLNWLEQHSMTSILNDAGILPSNTKMYAVQDINRAIAQRLGVHPAIECRKEHGHSFLAELRICFDKNLQLQNCDGAVTFTPNSGIITNCDLQGNIYPLDASAFEPPQSIFVHLFNLVSWLQWVTL